jgi:hypothetical protein
MYLPYVLLSMRVCIATSFVVFVFDERKAASAGIRRKMLPVTRQQLVDLGNPHRGQSTENVGEIVLRINPASPATKQLPGPRGLRRVKEDSAMGAPVLPPGPIGVTILFRDSTGTHPVDS